MRELYYLFITNKDCYETPNAFINLTKYEFFETVLEYLYGNMAISYSEKVVNKPSDFTVDLMLSEIKRIDELSSYDGGPNGYLWYKRDENGLLVPYTIDDKEFAEWIVNTHFMKNG